MTKGRLRARSLGCRSRFVVYLDHAAALSGGELALARTLPALSGVRSLVWLAEIGPLADRLRADGIEVELIPMPEVARGLGRDRVNGRLPLASVAGSAAYVLTLALRLRRLRPDLVHTNSLKAALYGGLAARLAGVPVVWHIRDRIAPDYLPLSAVRLVRAAARLLPAGVIANSAATLATLGPLRVPSAVIPSPLEPGTFPAPDRPPRPVKAPFTVVMVGRLSPWKGQHVFLDAFARAFPGDGSRAVVVGAALFGEHTYAADLRRQAELLGIADRVEFAGFRKDVAVDLARADVLVHASTVPEPFGLAVVEGMAAGLPVVAAAAGGPAEVITDGIDGLLSPPGDADALASVLRRLAADDDLRARLGVSALQRAREFTPEIVGRRLIDFYRMVEQRRSWRPQLRFRRRRLA